MEQIGPHQKFDLLVDEVIDNEISHWIEEKQREPEQILLIEEEDAL